MVHRPTGKLGLRLVLVAAIACSFLAVSVGSALAAFSHPFETKFKVNGECLRVQDIVVQEPEGWVYVSCRAGIYPNEADLIKRFDLDGKAVNFAGSADYINGNTLTGDPGSSNGKFLYEPQIAVDNNPASPNHGKVFVTSSPNVDIFNPDGTYAGAIEQPLESTIPNHLYDIDIGPDSSIYLTSGAPGGRVSKYNPAFKELKRMYTQTENQFFGNVDAMRVDSKGAIWARRNYGSPTIQKFEADQFTEELTPALGFPPAQLVPFLADPSPFSQNPILTGKESGFDPNNVEVGDVGGIDVDLSDNDLYVSRNDRIETWSEGDEEEASHPDAPDFGEGVLSETDGITVTADHHVYAGLRGPGGVAEVARFGAGPIVPDVHTFKADIDQIGHEGATIGGEVQLAGGSDITGCKFEYGTENGSGEVEYTSSTPCSPDPSGSNFSTDQVVSATLSGLTTGTEYHYRLVGENATGANYGIDRVVTPAFVLKTRTLPATGVDDEGATLNGSFDPDGEATEYHFEYGVSTHYGLETATTAGGEGHGEVPVGTPITGLPKGKTFHYRLVAENAKGTTLGPDLTFRTAAPPDIFGARATDVAPSSAVLHAAVNPSGYETTYRFEYGITNSYGQSAPVDVAETEIGAGSEPIQVEQALTGLQEGVTYHFRVVAENQWGQSATADTTFDYSPPTCPNDHVRQETGSSYLPDCRAYEIVSPGTGGPALLFPGEVPADATSNQTYSQEAGYIVNRGFASAPARFAFYGGISTLEGLDTPISPLDMYMSTRTNSGWVTEVPGLQGGSAFVTGRKECSESLALCADHSETISPSIRHSFSPYVYSADGDFVRRLPTNLNVIPNGEAWVGSQAMSGDFSHFVFSTNENSHKPAIPFTADGLTEGLGSAYDNDIGARSVKLISRNADGNDFEALFEPGLDEKGIEFHGVSPDGSHILMEVPAPGGLKQLYMRVNDIVTFDIAKGHDVEPIGMTRNGEKVFFISKDRLIPSDQDESTDLYMWQQGGTEGTLTVLSQNGQSADGDAEHRKPGNRDDCEAAWGVSGCGVLALDPKYAHPDANEAVSAPGQDDLFAETAGDIYFYSPELLDPQKPGIENERNLYVFREGAPHLVATLDPGTEISRMQISPDGSHAALLTASQLTSYDNKGFKEVYTYDARTGAIRCASCNPSGEPPTSDVLASMGGRFMSNDGRAFFATPDSLVPRDRNGGIIDVYEYVDGRPQLITSGLGARDFTGGGKAIKFVKPAHTGLEAVSRDGTDVFFSTFETLVKSDNNGEFVKFYDARVNGGFANQANPAPCAAADECHGSDSSPPPAPTISSGGNLGNGGNFPTEKAKKAKKKHRAKKHRAKNGKSQRHGAKHAKNARSAR